MDEKQFIERITMQYLDEQGTIKGTSFEMSIKQKNSSTPHILVVCAGMPNSFSYSKYGLKQAKLWLMERIC